MINRTRRYDVRRLISLVLSGLLAGWLISATPSHAEMTPRVENTTGPISGISVQPLQSAKEYRVLWPGHRILTGTVESVVGDLVKVNTGELLPRFLPVKEAIDKGLPPLKKGDQIRLAINDHNLVVDYHLIGQDVWHRIIRGRLAQPLPVGQEWAVIRTDRGKEEALSVRPLARSKVSVIPVNAPAVFLADEANKIIDAAFGDETALQQQTGEWKKSPPKAPYRRIEGTLVRSPGWVIIRTPDGKDQAYEVRPYIQEKLVKSPEGGAIILMVDDENKVSDLAVMNKG
ncbi:MAG TPA: hypothetical protein VJV04_03420 [Nitrospiraceae bacterium]|nr:hypothetical protein [Nitrospiraceae bacterium]